MKTFREIAEMHYASEPSNEFDKKYRENRIAVLEKLLTKQLRIGVVSNSEVFEHYGKPFTSGRDLWDFLTAHYNFTPKT